jgi:hypothetical protein
MATRNLPLSWNIALSAWVIQDGNYLNFRVGEIVEFAVEFYQEEGVSVRPTAGDISSTLLHDTTYEVVSEVVCKTETIAIIDIGILVYRHNARPPKTLGENRFRTQLALEVDPYSYFEGLSRLQNVPSLIYSWREVYPSSDRSIYRSRCRNGPVGREQMAGPRSNEVRLPGNLGDRCVE